MAEDDLDPKALEGDFMALAAHLAKANAGRAVINRDSDGATFVHRDVAIEAMQALIEAIAAWNRRTTPADVSGLVEPTVGSGAVTDAMVEAAIRGWDKTAPFRLLGTMDDERRGMRGALEAVHALSRSQPSPARGVEAVRVKALEEAVHAVEGIRKQLGEAGGVGQSGAADAQLERNIAGPWLEIAQDAILALEPAPARAPSDTGSAESTWIEWSGETSTPPVEPGGVEIRLRNGTVHTQYIHSVRWLHNHGPFDVVAYRSAPARADAGTATHRHKKRGADDLAEK